jgi:hypothetical protein
MLTDVKTLFIESYELLNSIHKIAYIGQLSDGRWRVYSEKGKNLGTSKTKGKKGKGWAKKRLQQVEMFKHMDKKKKAEQNYLECLNVVAGIENDSDERILKLADRLIEMGDPERAGRGLADIVKFLMKRISPEKMSKSLTNLRKKIWHLNENAIADKRTPASASLGQSITFIKTVLNGHDPKYIRQILESIVKNLG